MGMKITRRKLALVALGSASAVRAERSQAAAAAQPEDHNAVAKEQLHKDAEALAKFNVPVSTEPAFQFKA